MAAAAVRRGPDVADAALYVPGNHDPPDLDVPGNVDSRVTSVGGVRVAGLGGAGPGDRGWSYEWSEEELAGRQLPECDLLLTHAPPGGTTLDLDLAGRHLGSPSLRRLADRHATVLVCGHVHESPGALRRESWLGLNVGSLGPPDGRLQAGLVEVEPGGRRAAVGHFVPEEPGGWTLRSSARLG